MSVPAILSNGSCIRFWGMWKTIALVLFTLSEKVELFFNTFPIEVILFLFWIGCSAWHG